MARHVAHLPAAAHGDGGGIWIWSILHAVRIAGKPLLLYEGSENQVLAGFIWSLWNEGNIGIVGAIGAVMILLLLLVTVGLRLIGFGRSASV